MKWVVLGAGGLLGQHMVQELEGREVVALDRRACDISDADSVLARTCGAQVIVNCAAYTNVDGAEAAAEAAFSANARGAENAARAALCHGARLVHVSTDFVFDGAQSAPYDESATPNPQSVYARSKLAGERLVERVGGRYYIARVQGLYGVGGTNFASRLHDFLRAGRTLKLDGERRVQPTWARAVARQLVRLAESDHFGTYHLSCHGETTWAGFARALAARLELAPNWQEVATAELGAAAARPPNCLFAHRELAAHGLDLMPDWHAALDEYLKECA